MTVRKATQAMIRRAEATGKSIDWEKLQQVARQLMAVTDGDAARMIEPPEVEGSGNLLISRGLLTVDRLGSRWREEVEIIKRMYVEGLHWLPERAEARAFEMVLVMYLAGEEP